LDVKCGNGAFMPTLDQAQALAISLANVARGAGLAAAALITDMNQVLGVSAGNALEVQEALDYLTGRYRDPRLHHVTRALATQMLRLGGLASSDAEAHAACSARWTAAPRQNGLRAWLRCWGGPADVLRKPHLPVAAVQMAVRADRAGVLAAATSVRSAGVSWRSAAAAPRRLSSGSRASAVRTAALGQPGRASGRDRCRARSSRDQASRPARAVSRRHGDCGPAS
jgi:thymidine phosphorylase